MRSAAIHALNTLGRLQGVHVGVWLAQGLENLQPPLMARRFVPVKVRVWVFAFLWWWVCVWGGGGVSADGVQSMCVCGGGDGGEAQGWSGWWCLSMRACVCA